MPKMTEPASWIIVFIFARHIASPPSTWAIERHAGVSQTHKLLSMSGWTVHWALTNKRHLRTNLMRGTYMDPCLLCLLSQLTHHALLARACRSAAQHLSQALRVRRERRADRYEHWRAGNRALENVRVWYVGVECVSARWSDRAHVIHLRDTVLGEVQPRSQRLNDLGWRLS